MTASFGTLSGTGRSILAAIALLSVAGCRASGPEAATNETEQGASGNLSSVVPLPQAVDRQELLLAVMRAASDAAIGRADPAADRALDGRPFEVRIRFGCEGPAADLDAAPLGWSLDEQRTLRVRAAPTVAASDSLVQGAAGAVPYEAVEGFWIPRPWLLSAACPSRPSPVAPPTPAQGEEATPAPTPIPVGTPLRIDPIPVAPRVGIVRFYQSNESRTGRRNGRAFQATLTLAEGAPPITQGLDLVLSGRLRALAGRRVVHCVVTRVDSPPECLVSAQIDRVRIEQPGVASPIAEWTTG